jgi:hypothetical protein
LRAVCRRSASPHTACGRAGAPSEAEPGPWPAPSGRPMGRAIGRRIGGWGRSWWQTPREVPGRGRHQTFTPGFPLPGPQGPPRARPAGAAARHTPSEATNSCTEEGVGAPGRIWCRGPDRPGHRSRVTRRGLALGMARRSTYRAPAHPRSPRAVILAPRGALQPARTRLSGVTLAPSPASLVGLFLMQIKGCAGEGGRPVRRRRPRATRGAERPSERQERPLEGRRSGVRPGGADSRLSGSTSPAWR